MVRLVKELAGWFDGTDTLIRKLRRKMPKT